MTKPGLYQHYKGARYLVLFTGSDSTNGREGTPMVAYVGLEPKPEHKSEVKFRVESQFNDIVNPETGDAVPFSPSCGLHAYLEPDGRCECIQRFKYVGE